MLPVFVAELNFFRLLSISFDIVLLFSRSNVFFVFPHWCVQQRTIA